MKTQLTWPKARRVELVQVGDLYYLYYKGARVMSKTKGVISCGFAEGDKINKLKLVGTSQLEFDINDFKGKYVILYFYPRDMTSGCTTEGHEFSKLKTKFEKLNTFVFGISRDSIESHNKFKTKENFLVDLLSDLDQQVCTAFDVIKDKNMYGKKVKGIERSTFVISPEGILIKEWRKVKAEGHAEQVYLWVVDRVEAKKNA